MSVYAFHSPKLSEMVVIVIPSESKDFWFIIRNGWHLKFHEVSKESQSVLDISIHSFVKLFIFSISDLHSKYGKLLKLFILKKKHILEIKSKDEIKLKPLKMGCR